MTAAWLPFWPSAGVPSPSPKKEKNTPCAPCVIDKDHDWWSIFEVLPFVSRGPSFEITALRYARSCGGRARSCGETSPRLPTTINLTDLIGFTESTTGFYMTNTRSTICKMVFEVIRGFLSKLPRSPTDLAPCPATPSDHPLLRIRDACSGWVGKQRRMLRALLSPLGALTLEAFLHHWPSLEAKKAGVSPAPAGGVGEICLNDPKHFNHARIEAS